MSCPRVIIGAQSSGSGKTTVTCGILQALVNRGMKVASFKCGPDYIDPMFHSNVIGARSKNLDPFFVDDDTLRYLFKRTAEEHDISVIEGVMGFYDGNAIGSTESSTCDVSLKLSAPAILLVDAHGAAASALATLKGFLEFGRNNIKGVIFNRMSENVFKTVGPMAEKMGVKAIGYVPKLKDITLESRHLGLVMPSEIADLKDMLKRLADILEETLDLDALIDLANTAPDIECNEPVIERTGEGLRIGLAKDETFCFTYEDNIELFRRAGAEIVEFSPMHDRELPDVDMIVLSGGYPELYGEALESNTAMRDAIRDAVANGMYCLAECGGFMYLHDTMEDSDGVMRKMCEVIHGSVTNRHKLTRFGYVTLHTKTCNTDVRGHEFHHWDSDNCGTDWTAVKTSGKTYECMHDNGTLIAGYPHLYYYSNPKFLTGLLKKIPRKH